MPVSFSPALAMTTAFAVALIAGLVLKFWLASRQMRHVANCRNVVPVAYAHSVSQAAHRKAADYTITKTRFGLLELAVGAAILLGWTLLGGLALLNHELMERIGPGMLQQVALLLAFALIGGVIELPLAWYTTFVIEERFGFNKTTLRLWVTDLLKSAAVGAMIGIPLVSVILWLMGAAGPYWWVWAWSTWMAFGMKSSGVSEPEPPACHFSSGCTCRERPSSLSGIQADPRPG